MKKKLSVVLVGVGGYGQIYLRKLLDPDCELPVTLVGGIDPFAQSSPMYPDLVRAGVPVYDTLERFYAEHSADIAILATPIHFHRLQSVCCMEHGSHVLCEKPVCAVIDDVAAMMEARDRTGKTLTIGYQWSHSKAIQRLKADVLAGRYGKAIRLKTIVLWPRTLAYYRRGSGWAARKRAPSGEWILDSVASNATAHYLHNMLYVCGARIDRSAAAKSIEVETYRANPIEMFDTCAMRVTTEENVEILFLASHAVAMDKAREPEFVFEYEKGTVTAETENNRIQIRGRLHDGTQILYGDPNEDQTRKLDWTVSVVQGKQQVVCGAEAACEHTKCVNKTEELIPETPFFPQSEIVFDEKIQMYYVRDLDRTFGRCYDEWRLPCELETGGFLPAQKGSLRGYRHFSGV